MVGAKRYDFQWEGAWYATDTIKVLSNLTLTLGLRHEFTNGWNVNPLGPVTYVYGTTGCGAGVAQCVQTQQRVNNQLLTANNSTKLFGPRVGLAWDPFGSGKTSIHAGYGTFYNLLDDLGYIIPPPGNFTITSPSFPMQVNPLTLKATPAPVGLFPGDAKTPAVQEWSFKVEQQLTGSTALSVGYVGSRGSHLLASADVNQSQSVICPASPCPASIPAGTKYFPIIAPATTPQRLNPSLANARSFDSIGYSTYESLQIDLRQRVAKGLTFRANYSFSKTMDDASVNLGSFFGNCPSSVLDALNPARDYAPSCYDVANRFSFSGSYELPMGKGKAFLGGVSGAANKVLGGWSLNGIVNYQTGMPFTPFVGAANSRDNGTTSGASPDRPSLNPNFSGPIILGKVNEWFNPNAFILPPAGTYGNAGRNILRGPGLSQVDMSLFKDTRITERVNLQFRAEFFNIFNHPNFGEPNASLFSAGNCSSAAGSCPVGVPNGTAGALLSTAGAITNTLNQSRQLQFGLKLIF